MLLIPDYLRYVSCFEDEIAYHFCNDSITEFSSYEQKKFLNPGVRRWYYESFQVPKKTGGFRDITAPKGKLKRLQSFIAELLSSCYSPDTCVKGFAKHESVVTNAVKHLHHNYILNIDIKDFFPSITQRMVRDSLIAKGVGSEVARRISILCTWYDSRTDDLPEEVLPQGTPTSPVLSNIVCHLMDQRLKGLAKRFGLVYSRYADDITFSSNHSVYSKDSEFWKELDRIIYQSGFTINEKKTRLLKQGSRQEVTGLTVGEKLNVSRKWLKNLRAAIFQMEMYGCSKQECRRIRGKLSYLKMVRGYDEVYWKLDIRYDNALHSAPFLEQHSK